MLNSCVMHHHTGPAPGIMVWGGIGYHSRTPLVRIAAATPDQLWQRVEAAWSSVPQEHIQSIFESMPRRVAAVISNNGGYSGY
ncbi:transposable element Tcb1 transposase [Trichonephila clavipes]|nr:transposable element Tcb1 transposase [Trichonephila clavipes]